MHGDSVKKDGENLFCNVGSAIARLLLNNYYYSLVVLGVGAVVEATVLEDATHVGVEQPAGNKAKLYRIEKKKE